MPIWIALLTASAFAGCAAQQPDFFLVDHVNQDDLGRARAQLQQNLPAPKADKHGYDRNYLLQRMRLALVTLADGYAWEHDRAIDEVYTVLTTQGINKDKTVAAVFINEDLKTWKGEPFEQALMLHYISTYWAMQGSWDNARAAIQRSLFHLRDFNAPGSQPQHIDTRELLERAYAYEEGSAAKSKAKDSYLDHGYTPIESDFTLGYLMTAIANQQLAIATGDTNRQDEAMDNYHAAVKTRPSIQPLVEELQSAGGYNTILVVDYGQGPQKIGTGPDNAIAAFRPGTPSDGRKLLVSVDGRPHGGYTLVCDVNRMAADHRWNNLEDVRLAKSYLGTGLLTAGAITTGYGADRHNSTALLVGLGMMAAGAIAKAGAHADTRYCQVIPQRVYVVPVKVDGPATKVTLQVEGAQQSRLVLTGLSPPPAGQPAQLRVVRLVSAYVPAPPWAVSGRIYYSNDRTGQVDEGVNLPYILGGNCVRRPTDDVLTSYQRSGFLRDMTLWQLQDLYRMEGIQLDPRDDTGRIGLHVLEGGKSLVEPLAGTAGFARLFGQVHQAYQPTSPQVRALAQQLRAAQGQRQVAHAP